MDVYRAGILAIVVMATALLGFLAWERETERLERCSAAGGLLVTEKYRVRCLVGVREVE